MRTILQASDLRKMIADYDERRQKIDTLPDAIRLLADVMMSLAVIYLSATHVAEKQDAG